jgi:plastocyanin
MSSRILRTRIGTDLRTRRVAVVSAVGAILATLAVAPVAWAGASHRNVQILDDCDAETFNAALGEGACVKDGGVTFDEFIGQLITRGEAPAWRFAPEHLKLNAGGTVTASNRGGEFHTFTEVAAFGGGCVAELNALLGLEPVPECAIGDIFPTTGVPPGGNRTTGPLAGGTHRFQCLIHPWQRTTVQAR